MRPNLSLESITGALAVLGTGVIMAACGGEEPKTPVNATEVPAATEKAGEAAGHCGATKDHKAGEAACSADKKAGDAKPSDPTTTAAKPDTTPREQATPATTDAKAATGATKPVDPKAAPATGTAKKPATPATPATPAMPAKKGGSGSCGAGTCSAKK